MAHRKALRIRVIKAVVEDGLSRNEAARIFRVGIASAIRWVKAFERAARRLCPRAGTDAPCSSCTGIGSWNYGVGRTI
jgi:putative transposase